MYRENQAGFGSSPGSATSSVLSTSVEYVIAPNQDRILRITPDASTDTVVIIEFYEV